MLQDPHAHIRYFNKITSTMRVPNVPSSSIKLMLFPFSLEGAARIWLEKEPPRSILTWDDLVTKIINQASPHHGFSELHQLDTFYNALNVNDQDSLNSAAGGNFLDKMPCECLKVIESKSKVRQSRAKAVVARLRRIMLLAVVLTRTKIVLLPAKTFIETTSKTMCHKLPQLITTKETPISDLRWLQIKFDLPVFLPFKPIKIISIRGTISIKTEVAPIPQTQSVSKTDFESSVKANDAVLRNMQNQGQNLQIQMANLTDMLSKFMSSNTASSSGSGTLPSNTITNPKEDLKGIITRSGVSYQGPTIPIQSKVVKQGTEVTKDQVKTPRSQSTAPVQPPIVQSKTQTPVS
nr:reverse transcriptase domain-containing protein [Tanacetum cinerariifolium]